MINEGGFFKNWICALAEQICTVKTSDGLNSNES